MINQTPHRQSKFDLFALKICILFYILIFCFQGLASLCKKSFEISNQIRSALQSTRHSNRSYVWKVSEPNGWGTGFFISPNQFVTNFHVLIKKGSLKAEDITLSQQQSFRTLKVKSILAMSALYDLVIFETTDRVSDYLSIRTTPIQSQEDVFITGYSGKKLMSIKNTNKISFFEDTISFLVNADVGGGMSGSPVVDKHKQVVGIVYANGGTSDSVMAVHSKYLQDLIQENFKESLEDNWDELLKREQVKLIHLARRGDVVAQFKLGFMCLSFFLTACKSSQDMIRLAIDWLQKAAQQGHAIAQYNLAVTYLEEGASQDLKQSIYWFQKPENKQYLAALQLAIHIHYREQ